MGAVERAGVSIRSGGKRGNSIGFVIGGDDDEAIQLSLEDSGNNCRIVCIVRGEKHLAEAPDFFSAFQVLRQRALEPKGLIPFCYGASLKVWPSAMSRDMGRGLKAYKIELGAAASDLIGIFEDGPDVIPSSVANQEAFAHDWFASLGR